MFILSCCNELKEYSEWRNRRKTCGTIYPSVQAPARPLGHRDQGRSCRRPVPLPFLPVKGQRGGDHFLVCSRNSGHSALFLALLPCLLCCVRPHDICHLFSVKFSCKVSQCVVPENQHVKLPGCNQIEFSRFIYMLVSQEGSGSLRVTHIHFQRAGVRWSIGRGVKTLDKLYLLWSRHMGVGHLWEHCSFPGLTNLSSHA